MATPSAGLAQHHRVRADLRARSDVHRTQDARATANQDVLVDARIAVVLRGADGVAAHQTHPRAELRVATDNGTHGVHEVHAWTNLHIAPDLYSKHGHLRVAKHPIDSGDRQLPARHFHALKEQHQNESVSKTVRATERRERQRAGTGHLERIAQNPTEHGMAIFSRSTRARQGRPSGRAPAETRP